MGELSGGYWSAWYYVSSLWACLGVADASEDSDYVGYVG